jgi:hypothetical protein
MRNASEVARLRISGVDDLKQHHPAFDVDVDEESAR